nr:hypothetical protein [Bacillus wiedmannii]
MSFLDSIGTKTSIIRTLFVFGSSNIDSGSGAGRVKNMVGPVGSVLTVGLVGIVNVGVDGNIGPIRFGSNAAADN